ncbi:MAG: DUF2190 family protein [Thermoguttaceae bacterium]|nr:DUF2190 family protein [Thermoguttaceae bacterium]
MAKLRQNDGCYDFLNTGETTLLSGTPILNGSLFGVVIREAKPGERCAIQTDGIWEFPIGSAETANIGVAAYWDATNSKITATAGTNVPVGRFVEAKAADEETCQVMINVGAEAAASGSGS